MLILSLILGACTTPKTPATAAPQPETPATAVPQPEPAVVEPVTIQYWSNGWFPSAIDGRKALVDKFNKENEGKVQVEYIQGDWSTGETYIQSGAAAGGGIACVMDWWSGGAIDFYSKGWVLDLAPYMTPERRALMIEEQWKARTADDGAIVANGTVLEEPLLMVHYNPVLLEAAGITPATVDKPWTWDELYANAKLLTLDVNGKNATEAGFDKDNVKQWGYIHRIDAEKAWQDGMFFAQGVQGESIVREENGKWGWFLNDKGAAAYNRFLSIVREGIAPEATIGLGGDTLEQMFVDGMAAMILRPAFAIPILHNNFPDFKFSSMPVPMDANQKVFYQAGGEGMVVTKNCEHPKEAADFLFWLMEPENSAVLAYGNGMLPATYEALKFEPFKSDPTWDIVRNYLDIAQIFTIPFNPNYLEFRDTVLGPTYVEFAAGNMTFDEANNIITQQAEEILNR